MSKVISKPSMSADQIGSFIEANVATVSSFEARADENPVNQIGAYDQRATEEPPKAQAWGNVHQMVAKKQARCIRVPLVSQGTPNMSNPRKETLTRCFHRLG